MADKGSAEAQHNSMQMNQSSDPAKHSDNCQGGKCGC